MITHEGSMEIRVLYKQGKSIREIVDELEISRNTVRKYLKNEKSPSYKERQVPSKLDSFKDYLKVRVKDAYPVKIPATVLLQEIKTQGYTGQISILRDYLVKIREVKEEEKVIRFETERGHQMQVDWTVMQKRPWRISAFVAVLGYSRKAYVEFVSDETGLSLLQCHLNAFEYFEGVPKEILYDNMKTVIIQRDKYGLGKHGFQKTFMDFAKHYGFVPRVCRPYRAQTKGKVERFNRYLKESFYFPLITKQAIKPGDYDILNREARRWLKDVADVRILKDFGKSPHDLFLEEASSLLPLSPTYCLLNKEKKFPLVEVLQHDLSIYDQLVGV